VDWRDPHSQHADVAPLRKTSLSWAQMTSTHSDSVPAAGPGASPRVSIRIMRSVLATIVCPGLGEWYLGYRRLAASFVILFMIAAGLLLVGSYASVHDLAERAKRQDPQLNEQPMDVGEAVALSIRLYPAIIREYQKDSVAIRKKVGGPLLLIFVLYIWSLIQSVVLAWRDLPVETSSPVNPAENLGS